MRDLEHRSADERDIRTIKSRAAPTAAGAARRGCCRARQQGGQRSAHRGAGDQDLREGQAPARRRCRGRADSGRNRGCPDGRDPERRDPAPGGATRRRSSRTKTPTTPATGRSPAADEYAARTAITRGTLGCFLVDTGDTSKRYGLTYFHVVDVPDVAALAAGTSEVGQPSGSKQRHRVLQRRVWHVRRRREK